MKLFLKSKTLNVKYIDNPCPKPIQFIGSLERPL